MGEDCEGGRDMTRHHIDILAAFLFGVLTMSTPPAINLIAHYTGCGYDFEAIKVMAPAIQKDKTK